MGDLARQSAHRDEVDVDRLADDEDAPDHPDHVPPEHEVGAGREQHAKHQREDDLRHSAPTSPMMVRSPPTTVR
jgi:hypothetical protein